ncbi:T9SS type A sorting domain-containing protein [Lewinella cohaerens]|uniref:T9SS type A sorting domain-containing protein n=1 Tax=Lewinella cohaerens TaxID=70995 RepID=UPI00047806B4|nr:T9SS type A sorting domain-containing protein [Lewinella cohaerens]
MKKLVIIIISILMFKAFVIGQNQNLSNGDVFDGEPYLAIDPNDAQHLVVAWMGWIDIFNQFKIKTKTSFDGGQTWTSVTELPHTVSNYSSADPCIAFNANGDAFISYIDFTGTTPPVTGGVYLCKSTDGGISWGAPKEVINTDYDGNKWPIDRPWMVIDQSTSGESTAIYLTTFNLNRTAPSFNPYLSFSNDGGNTFSTRYLDTIGWLAGSLNPFPMCSPTVNNAGIFHGVYPSFVLTQSLSLQIFHVSSDDGGNTLNHKNIPIQAEPATTTDYPNAKKAPLLLSDPADDNHLVYLFLGADYGNLDVFMIETFNAGIDWSVPLKLNDAPIGNNRMQDMLWGDFDNDGDLVVSWRDRRNGTDGSYQTASEVWATYRAKDSLNFSPNFQITNETVAFDVVLESAGNDFMCIKMQDDIINTTWGDTRNGKLNIWFQSMTIDGIILSSQQLSPEKKLQIAIYPNPTTSRVAITGKNIKSITIYNINSKAVLKESNDSNRQELNLDLAGLSSGVYLVQVNTSEGILTKKLVKE